MQIKGVLTDYTVVMVTCYIKRKIKTCPLVIRLVRINIVPITNQYFMLHYELKISIAHNNREGIICFCTNPVVIQNFNLNYLQRHFRNTKKRSPALAVRLLRYSE